MQLGYLEGPQGLPQQQLYRPVSAPGRPCGLVVP